MYERMKLSGGGGEDGVLSWGCSCDGGVDQDIRCGGGPIIYIVRNQHIDAPYDSTAKKVKTGKEKKEEDQR
jgi:hypothetical protein